MGWQDRDWAKWTDEERARFYGSGRRTSKRATLAPTTTRDRSISGVFLAVVVSLALSLVAAYFHFHVNVGAADSRSVATPLLARHPFLYGTQSRRTGGSQKVTCTAMVAAPPGPWSCIEWSIVMPGQSPREARRLATDTPCVYAKVVQEERSWVCVRER